MREGTGEASEMQEMLYKLSWAVATQVCAL